MINEELERIFSESSDISYVKVTGDGKHFHITIVSDSFVDKGKLQRQRWVYSHLKEKITSGEIHALTMDLYTKIEWGQNHG